MFLQCKKSKQNQNAIEEMSDDEYQQSNNLCVKWQIYTSIYLCVQEKKLIEHMIS